MFETKLSKKAALLSRPSMQEQPTWPSAHYRVTLPPNLPSNSPDKRYQAQPGSHRAKRRRSTRN